jgi:hypothetical protein
VSQHGWGVPYQFPYKLTVVLTYLTAYALGIVGYGLTWRHGSWLIGTAGTLLCAAGFVSFAYELTHWASDHYGSWIASAPVALLPLALIAVVAQFRSRAAGSAVA